ncbi:MAG: hypothetical protein GWN00_19605, partial [Aliifodinibius sp.]|nr:hypothetical protein [Fodinibius sp.]NIV13275.1 hypothetical protein [Fodinibius sp.]NIY26929.1 hypothetical protein [Fodinibius sp.]
MKYSLLGVIFVVVIFGISHSQPIGGVDYLEKDFWVVFNKGIQDIEISERGSSWVTGIKSFDLLMEESGIQTIEQEMPFATPDDRDGDIVLPNVYRLTIESNSNIVEIVQKFQEDGNVVLAELIPIYHLYDVSPFNPNDPYFASEWYIHKIQAPLAWGMWNGAVPDADSVVIAIIDTGTDW